MERLTARNKHTGLANCAMMCKSFSKDCADVINTCFDDILERLAAYEDAEEEGRLVALPCKVGDAVWMHDWRENPRKSIYEGYVTSIEVHRGGILLQVRTHGNSNFAQNNNWNGGIYTEFGKNIFQTREEAEAALKEKAND